MDDTDMTTTHSQKATAWNHRSCLWRASALGRMRRPGWRQRLDAVVGFLGRAAGKGERNKAEVAPKRTG